MGGGGGRAPAAPDDPASPRAAEEVALRILAAASQSAAGLRRRLERRGFTREAAGAAVNAMVEHGYVDDEALAGSIAARRQGTGHGRLRVAAELRARGLSGDAIAQTLGDVDPEAERGSAMGLATRLAQRVPAGTPARQRAQRVGAALQRRGFDGETVAWTLRQLEQGG